MGSRISGATGRRLRLLVSAFLVGTVVIGVGAGLSPGTAGADSGSFAFTCNVPTLGLTSYVGQVQGSIPSGLAAGTSFPVSGLEFTATTSAIVDAGDTISGSVTTSLDATGATPSSENVTLDITPIVVPSPPATVTYVFTPVSTPTFSATGGPVVISVGPSVSAFDLFVNGAPAPTFSCSLPSPGAAIAYSSPAGDLVANAGDNTVSVVDPSNGIVDGTIPVGTEPTGIAITPNGQDAYVADAGSHAVSVIDTATGTTVGAPISVGTEPVAVAITPDGQTAYVTNEGAGTVTPITLSTGKAGPPIVLSTPIGFSSEPSDIVITPDGSTAYVADAGNNEIHVVDLTTDTEVAHPSVFSSPSVMAMSPDGSNVYVDSASEVAVIPTASNTVASYIPLGTPGTVTVSALALTPDGATLYAAIDSDGGGTVVPVTTASDTVGSAISLPDLPTALAFSADGATAYVTVAGSTNALVPVTVATGTVGSPIGVGIDPAGVAIEPDQAPVAALSVTANFPGEPSTFDASQSTSTTSPIASYTWDVGDGSPPLTTTTPTTTWAYSAPGTYQASVTVTDTAGTSTEQTFTGQTVSNSGDGAATASQQVVIVPCTSGEPCTAHVTSPTVTSDVTGTSSTDALLAVSIGQQIVSCGTSSAQSEEVTTYATTTFTATSLQATLTIANLATTQGFAVCYDSTAPFLDAQGQSAMSGTLPVCDPTTPVAPCLVSATEEAGSVVAVLDVLPGDPRFWASATLSLKSFSPRTGVAGTKVTLTGSGLAGVTAVTFGQAAPVLSLVKKGKEISAVVPTGATSGPITILGAQGTAASSTPFVLAKPTIKAVKATPGKTATIKGKDLAAVSQVTVDGIIATVTKNTATTVTIVVPNQAEKGQVVVVTPGGTATATFTPTGTTA
jgi:YVTN family beta-propeller protein